MASVGKRKLKKILKETEHNYDAFRSFKEITGDIWSKLSRHEGSSGPESDLVPENEILFNMSQLRSMVKRGIKEGEQTLRKLNSGDEAYKRVKRVLDDLKNIKREFNTKGDPHSVFANSFQHHQFALEDLGSYDAMKGRGLKDEPRRPDLDDPEWF